MIHLKDRNIFIMSIRELRRTLTPFHIIMQEYISSETSASLGISEDALYSPAGLGETNTRVHHTRLQTSSRESFPVAFRTGPIALVSYQPV